MYLVTTTERQIMSRLQQHYGGLDWHGLVVAKIQELRHSIAKDAEMFEGIYGSLDDSKSARDGQKLERTGKSATLSYKGERVLSFSVNSGAVIVDDGQDERSFPGAEDAVEHMATLMAAAVERVRSA
jgi:hypothetical protein